MAAQNDILSGFLDVKVSLRQRRRGFTPWKVWRKQWCELRHVGGSQHVVEFRVNSARNGPSPSNFIIPRSAILCRTESRSKRFAFGIFSHGNMRKPIFFLAGNSETNTQMWMETFRRMLTVSKYLPLREGTFAVSLIDNQHSRTSALTGLYGTLSTGPHGVAISDPTTGHPKLVLPWHQLLQFHLAATGVINDEKKICIIHTSSEFPGGAGQLHLFCENAPQLLQKLNNRGRVQRLFMSSSTQSLTQSNRRLSRSEGDLNSTIDADSLRDSGLSSCSPPDNNTPVVNIRSKHRKKDINDDTVRISMTSDDSGFVLKSKTASALITTGLGLLGCTTSIASNNTTHDVFDKDVLMPLLLNMKNVKYNRRESGVSIASGIYEEISEDTTDCSTNNKSKPISIQQTPNHYEDPIEIKLTRACTPPPLPPRKFQDRHRIDSYSDDALDDIQIGPSSLNSLHFSPAVSLQYLPRCHTMPSKSRYYSTCSSSSQDGSGESIDDSDYTPMSPGHLLPSPVITTSTTTYLTESIYLPMSPVIKTTISDDANNLYMDMSGGIRMQGIKS